MERKKKVVIHSNFCLAKTGFGRHAKLLLSYLHKTGKYDLVEYAAAPLTWNHPLCKSMPWKAYGALPDDEKELAPYQHDASLIQAIKYGEYNINKVLETEKPDALIMIEDIWGIAHFNKPWIGKFAHVFWTPIDSLPLLPVFEHNKGKFGNLWVKAKFAQKALKEKGIEAEFMPALIDNADFTILSEERKEELRKKFGISKDTLVFGFVFRNQLRKLVGTLIEAFAEFKKQNPEVNSKLFLHTCWTEQEGWRIDDFLNRFGVKREDVLTTHVCYKCKEVSVKPFYGQDGNCKKCHSEKSVHTISVDVGVTEQELCELYNICDAYIHPATSGGFEMPVLEAMFSGLPVATTNYSYGEDFAENSLVFPLSFTTYHEKGSQFNKAQVHVDSIVEFMNRINQMSVKDRRDIGSSLREWALSVYDSDKVCKKVEEFLDNIPYTAYNFDFSTEKNEKYPKPEGLDNQSFIIDLYKNVLKMDVENNPAEINNAMSLFNQGLNQDQVYQKFIEVAQSQNKQQKKVQLKDLIDYSSDKKRMLYVEPGGYGDIADAIIAIQALESKYPSSEWDFYVATLVPELFDHLPFIKKTIPYDPFLDDVFGMEGIDNHLGFFDMAYHPKYVRNCPDYYKNNF